MSMQLTRSVPQVVQGWAGIWGFYQVRKSGCGLGAGGEVCGWLGEGWQQQGRCKMTHRSLICVLLTGERMKSSSVPLAGADCTNLCPITCADVPRPVGRLAAHVQIQEPAAWH